MPVYFWCFPFVYQHQNSFINQTMNVREGECVHLGRSTWRRGHQIGGAVCTSGQYRHGALHVRVYRAARGQEGELHHRGVVTHVHHSPTHTCITDMGIHACIGPANVVNTGPWTCRQMPVYDIIRIREKGPYINRNLIFLSDIVTNNQAL